MAFACSAMPLFPDLKPPVVLPAAATDYLKAVWPAPPPRPPKPNWVVLVASKILILSFKSLISYWLA